MSLKVRLKEQQILAMRAKDKVRLGTIRMLLAAIKQIEIDERIELDNDAVTAVVIKSVKQRKDSISQFAKAGRADLVDIEEAELAILQEFLPQPLTSDEVKALIEQAIASTGASGMQDMGKVMGVLKKDISGKADMAEVSALVRAGLV
ncbi:GatB/YqeY domain-containing protein [Psychromonas sp. Urea-02u-13]|uniref:GatB/YqeY domain-containing protein n=1 Tax=Psychromonas sp. Urea-02u-13 TaxID=2058326 RepID=UPI000C32BC1F|nr:GatB/YqeY domain-containing protein [Psychromonas sp. Urea-02u-13]PKG39469.1 glutamyl-tRNA amidotransferase [Psychromonas sp. Urea-02u-13]